MSLINRIEISNFVCLPGPEVDDSEWEPLFRHNLLDLGSQSTAISMPNGTGKTSLAEAVIAILSRDRVLAQCTREKMAPASFGYYSHIKVELLIPRSSSANDLFVSVGHSVPGETWVFGICGFRGQQNSLSYYYYKGLLEDCPVVKTDGDRKSFISNAEFKECRKNISGFHFNVDKSDWSQQMSNHDFRPHTLQQMATFQKNGGGDTSSSIYNIIPRRNEKYNEAFFYSIIAPELLSGAMSDEDSEGDEFYLEDTFRKSGQKYIRAKHETVRRGKELEREEGTLEALEKIAKKADQALSSELEMKQLFSKISEEAAVINSLIKQRFVGIPFANEYPTGKTGELAKGIMVIPRFGVAIQDAVLAKTIGKTTGNLNRDAMNVGISGVNITQPIEIIVNHAIQDQISIDSGGWEGRCYSQDQAQKLLRGNDKVLELVNDVFQWFETSVDTNAYRIEVSACTREIKSLLSQVDECEKKEKSLKEKRESLESMIKKIDSYQDAWSTLNSKGCFTAEELTDPETTARKVLEERESASQLLSTHNAKVNKLKPLQAAYEKIQDVFGTGAAPASILAENESQIVECKKRRASTNDEATNCKSELEKLKRENIRIKKEIEECSTQIGRLESLSEQAKEYQAIFGGISPDGLEQKVTAEKNALNHRLSELPPMMLQHQETVSALESFRKRFPEQSPSEWIKSTTDQHGELVKRQGNANQAKVDLERQLNDLTNEKIAASPISTKALDTLKENGLSFSPLYQIVQSESIDENRKKKILSYFSALLFAPVLEDHVQAESAAKIFHECNIPVPVFLHNELFEFIKNGALHSAGPEGLVFNHQAGICTRTVDCIIDPSLIKKEKEMIQREVDCISESIAALSDEIFEVSPYSRAVSLAKRAAAAIDGDSEKALDELRAEQGELNSKSKVVNSRASFSAIKLINSMIEFDKAGGSEKIAHLSEVKSTLFSQKSELVDQLTQTKDKLIELNFTLEQCETELDRLILSKEIIVALDKAADFLSESGPAYMEKAESLSQELSDNVTLANERDMGAYLFSNAAKLEGQIKNDLQKHRADIKQIKEKSSRTAAFESALDDAVAVLLEKYKHLRSFLDMLPEQTNASDLSSKTVALASQYMSERGMSEKTDIDLLERLTGSFKAMQIKRNAGNARRSREKFNEEMRNLSLFVNENASSDVVSVNMKTALKMNAEKPIELKALRNQFSIDYDKAKDLFDKAQTAEQEVRVKAVERLVTFCDDARDNLRQMRDVLKGTEATLEIKAKVSDEDSLILVVDSMMTLIEEEEKHFNKTKENIAGEEEKYKQALTEKIKSRIYRGIFHDVEVKIIHPDLRKGKAFALSKKMSGGQKTAVALMVMAKLAEYSMRIESIREASNTASRRKAISRSASVLIVDGLFSNLSKVSLIRNSLASLKASRGNFQLIGLIHWPEYINNPDIFPTYIIGKEVADSHDPSGSSGFVYTENGSKIIHPKEIGRNPGELESVTFQVTN